MRDYITVEFAGINRKELIELGYKIIHVPYFAVHGHTKTKWQLNPYEKTAVDAARLYETSISLQEYLELFEKNNKGEQ